MSSERPSDSPRTASETAQRAPAEPFVERMRRRTAAAGPAVRRKFGQFLAWSRTVPGKVRSEVNRRGTRPRAWLGEPREWLDRKRKRFWVVLVLVVYSLFGFVLLPWIVKPKIVAALQSTFQRPAALDRLRINPYALSADLRGFRLTEPDGTPIARFERLYVNFQLSSLLRWAWCFDEIRLEGFKGNVVRFSETDTNIGRLLQTASANAEPQPSDAQLARLVVRRLRIDGASVAYEDRVPAQGFKTEVGPVDVAINRLNTLPDTLTRTPHKKGRRPLVIEMEDGARIEWTGTLGLNPIASSGHITTRGATLDLLARYFEDKTRITAPTGTSDSAFDYALVTRSDGGLGLTVSNLSFGLHNLTLHESGSGAPFLTLPELSLAGGRLAWPEHTASADAFALSGLDLKLVREANGMLSLERLLSPKAGAPATAASPPTPASAIDWTVTLGTFEIRDAKVSLDDRALREPGTVQLSKINMKIDALSNAPGALMPFTTSAEIAPGGAVKGAGKFGALPTVKLDAKVTASALQIAGAEPYLRDAVRVRIDSGRLNLETDVKIDESEPLAASGHMELLDLKLSDAARNEPIVGWQRVGIDRVDFKTSLNELQISEIAIGAPYLSFHVAKDRSTNIGDIMVAKPAPAAAADASVPPAKEPAAAAPDAKPMSVTIGRIVVERGSADFSDQSLPLPFAAHITDLKGDIATLATDTTAPARVNIRGQVGNYGESKIEGYLTPFDPIQRTKIGVSFRNVAFPDLSPYTLKFAGRRIAKGRLDLDLKYALDAGKLNGTNRVVIRNIELGEKVDTPGAMNLPLGLAVALLKDRDGKIDISLPVQGDVNDPKFALGGVIWDAVVNLFTNIATAPFRALMGLAGLGGGDNLDQIAFEPGRADLAPPEREKIQRIADALIERPTLMVTAPGAIDPEADRYQLQLDAVDAAIAKKIGDRSSAEGKEERWMTRQRSQLESLYKDRIGKEPLKALREQYTKPPPNDPEGKADLDEPAFIETLRDQVAKAEPIGDDALEALAQARANAVVDALKQVPGLDAQRVSTEKTEKSKKGDDGLVPLKLGAKSTRASD